MPADQDSRILPPVRGRRLSPGTKTTLILQMAIPVHEYRLNHILEGSYGQGFCFSYGGTMQWLRILRGVLPHTRPGALIGFQCKGLPSAARRGRGEVQRLRSVRNVLSRLRHLWSAPCKLTPKEF